MSTAAGLPKDRRGDELNLPAADVVEGLVGALISAAIGSVFATMDGAFSALIPSRLSALDEEAKGIAKAGLQRYLTNPKARHSQWLVGRVVFTALSAVLVADCLAPFVPHSALAPFGALGALLTYGILAEIGITLGRSRPDVLRDAASSRSSGPSSCSWSRSPLPLSVARPH